MGFVVNRVGFSRFALTGLDRFRNLEAVEATSACFQPLFPPPFRRLPVRCREHGPVAVFVGEKLLELQHGGVMGPFRDGQLSGQRKRDGARGVIPYSTFTSLELRSFSRAVKFLGRC